MDRSPITEHGYVIKQSLSKILRSKAHVGEVLEK